MKVNDWISHHFRHVFRSWRDLSKNWIISMVNTFVSLTLLGSGIVLFWRWSLLPPLVPLWYSLPWGLDQLASPAWLFILPVGSLLWYVTNVLLAVYVTHEYLIFTQTLFLTSLVTSLLSFLALVKIVFLVS